MTPTATPTPLPGPFSPTRAETAHWAMLAVIVLLAAFGFAFERVPAGGGLGWDGTIYARMVRSLGETIANGELSAYHAQRVLPAVVVKAILAPITGEPSDAAVIRAFAAYDLVLMLASCLLWKAIADRLALGLAGRWIGFCGLFLSFQAAKLTFYYPVLTDPTALFFGILTLHLYLAGRPVLLTLAAIVGAFSWPTISICAALLLLFPRRRPEDGLAPPAPKVRGLVVAYLAVAMLAAGFAVLLRATQTTSCPAVAQGLFGLADALRPVGGGAARRWMELNEPCAAMRRLLTSVPAVLGLALALFVMLLPVLNRAELATHRRRIRPLGVALAVAAVAVPIVIVRLVSDPRAPNPSSLAYLTHLVLLPAEGKFLMPLVGAFVYWGPIVLLAIPLWRHVSQAARRLGLGAALTIAATLPFGLVGEGRFLTAAWPFMVLAIVLVFEQRPAGRAFALAFAAATLVFSKVWMPINIAPWPGGPLDHLQDFPKQMYFMQFGPWMSWPTFLVHFALMAATGAWLTATLPRRAAD